MSITLKKNSLFVKDGGEYKDIAVYSAPQTVEKWLDNHPEITTSIQDGEVTFSKLNSTVQNRISGTESDVSTLQGGLSSEASARNAADTNLSNQISALRGAVGSPLVAATAAAMTDTDKIYVYTGNQSGYTNGNWYYYSGSAWVSGGVYNSVAIEVDDIPVQGSVNPTTSGGVYQVVEDIMGLNQYINSNIEYKKLLKTQTSYINVSNPGWVTFFPIDKVLIPCVKGEKFTVLAKIKSNVTQDYTYAIRLQKYTSSGVTGTYYYSNDFTNGSIIDEITILASDATEVSLQFVRKYTGNEIVNFNETFNIEYLIVIRGAINLNNFIKINASNISDEIVTNTALADMSVSPEKLTSLTDKYGILLRANTNCPNYNTTTHQLTIYKNTALADLKANTELIRTSEDIILDSNAAAQVNYLIFDTTTNTFSLKAQGKLSNTQIYLGAIARATGLGQIKCTHTINSYPIGSDLLLSDLTEKLPDTWKEKIESINTIKGTQFTFAIQTDTHYYNGYGDEAAKNLKLLTNYIGFDFVANLGDVIRGYSDEIIDSNENMRSDMTEIIHRYVTGISCPFMVAMGNHDTNRMWAITYSEEPFTFAEVWGKMFKPSFNTNLKAITETGSMHYYTDFNDVRVIVINTQDGDDGGFGISTEQLTWFTNIALNTNKWVLVLSHVPIVNGWSVSSNYVSSYANIVSALQSFKNNGGKVIACMSGHTHTQENKTVDDILYITFRNGGNICEVVQIDLNAKTINTIPVGFTGVGNRSFTFT